MRQRNKAVLLEHGRLEVSSRIEREFERIEAMVRRDLQGYPNLQRKLLDEITRIEEDYRKCGEVPPPPPDWVEAVAAVANVKSGSEIVQSILEEIKRSVDKMHEKTLGEYRRSYETRHKILEGFMPFWRSVDKTLTAVDKKLAELQNGASAVDAQMKKYETISAKTDKAEQMLTVSAFTQFAVALLVMLVAAGGAFINFKLIALPMSEMVGAGRLPDELAAHLGGGRAGHHPGRGVDGPVPDGGAAHHASFSAHCQPERAPAAPHDVDRAHPAGHACRC